MAHLGSMESRLKSSKRAEMESFLQQIQAELVQQHVSAHAGAEEGNSEGRGQQSPRAFDSHHPRPRGSGGAQAHPGADLRSRFPPGSYGYRPKRRAQEAVYRVAQAIDQSKTRVIDLDLRAYFDNVQHSLLLEKMARRVQDDAVMRLLKMILKATGKKGVPQGE